MRTIGLMSGTSLDAMDGVLIQWPQPGQSATNAARLSILSKASRDLPLALRQELLALNSPGADELHRSALAANALSLEAAAVVAELLQRAGVTAVEVQAIGLHGQTVRHRPGEFDGIGYTCQLHNASLLAELTGVDVICDFRSRDVSAGGQGAPLVPAFHASVFAERGANRAVLNLGGIANLTLLHADGRVTAWGDNRGEIGADSMQSTVPGWVRNATFVAGMDAQTVLLMEVSDCDADGIEDSWTIQRGVWDMNRNWVPDSCERTFGDLDMTGVIDIGDIALILMDFGPCAGCPTDLDGNGVVDMGDVSLLLMAFGPAA